MKSHTHLNITCLLETSDVAPLAFNLAVSCRFARTMIKEARIQQIK